MTLKGKAQELIEELQSKGRVVTLSKKSSFNLDHKMALGLIPIKKQAEKKLKNSYYHALEVERATKQRYEI